MTESKMIQPGCPYILSSTMKNDFPQVESVASARYLRGFFRLKLNDNYIRVWRASSTNSEIFDIFNIPINASTKGILDDPNAIVLSKKQAEKFFPDENPVGKEIAGMVGGQEQFFVVKGVFDDFPVNSTLQADCFVNAKWSVAEINKNFRATDAGVNWGRSYWATWVLLKDGTDPETVNHQFRAVEEKNINKNFSCTFKLQKLSDVYLHSTGIANTGKKGDLKNIRFFSAIVFLIILVAAFNYVMLSMAVSSGRSKEIAIRKTNGAGVKLIRKQLLGESVFLTLIVLPIAVGVALLAKPYAEKLFETKLYIIHSNLAFYIIIYLLLALFIGIFSGLYTSTYLSKLNVISILKNGNISGKRKSFVRFSLIMVQLVIFCSFISGTLIIRSQYKYALNKDLGYQTKNILLIKLGRNFKEYRAFINSLNALPEVKSAAGTMEALPMQGSMFFNHPNFQDPSKKIKIEGLAVDYNFIETVGLEVIEGRSFSEEYGADIKKSALLNQTAVKKLDMEDPVGKEVGGLTIIGVVKDFNLHSIRSDIPPLEIFMTDRHIKQVAVNYMPGKLDDLLPKIEKEWKAIAPDRSFQYGLIDDLIKHIYASEKNLSVIISIAALFSLLIAAFGLFGLTLFVARTRTKEVGVKKVLGSSQNTIIYSFLRENIIIVFISAVVSVPITWCFVNNWLSNFSYKTSINFWYFVVAFIVAALVVLFTIFFHSYKASRTNPVEALKYE